MIEDEAEKIANKTEAFHKLLTYCHCTDCLSAQEFGFLCYFASLFIKDQQNKKNDTKGYVWGF